MVDDRTLNDGESRYRALFDSIDEGFCVIEMIFDDAGKPVDYRFLEINPAFERQTGLRDAQGKRMRELAPNHEEHWFEIYGRISVTGEALRFQNRAEQLNRSYEVYAFRFGAPELRQVAILFNDISARERAQLELKQMEQALRESNQQLELRVDERTAQLREFAKTLERNNRELQDFAFVVSHDLQEPLRKIHVFGDRLMTRSGDALDDTGRSYIERILSSADRLRRLISDLLMFSRLSATTKPFDVVALDEVVRDVLADLEILIENSSARVIAKPLPKLQAHATQMHQLLQNLIGNALKFRRPGIAPVVTVSAEVIGDQVLLAVTDNGIGFDEKYRDRIFQVFQRLGDRDEYEGSGIGLAVCRRIVEAHGGNITASSRPGEGATFVVTLPLTQS